MKRIKRQQEKKYGWDWKRERRGSWSADQRGARDTEEWAAGDEGSVILKASKSSSSSNSWCLRNAFRRDSACFSSSFSFLILSAVCGWRITGADAGTAEDEGESEVKEAGATAEEVAVTSPPPTLTAANSPISEKETRLWCEGVEGGSEESTDVDEEEESERELEEGSDEEGPASAAAEDNEEDEVEDREVSKFVGKGLSECD